MNSANQIIFALKGTPPEESDLVAFSECSLKRIAVPWSREFTV